MTDPLDILRAPAPRPRLNVRVKKGATDSRVDAKKTRTSTGDLALAVASYNAMHPVHELLASAGVELHEQGREWHTVNGCPLPGCTSTHDAFRVHIDRKAGDTRGPQWACRKCQRGGDALRLAMYLDGMDPKQSGATAAYLRERGYLFRTGKKADYAKTSHRKATKPGVRAPHFAQDRLRSPGTGSGTSPRKKTPRDATNLQPTLKGQGPVIPAPSHREGFAVQATGEGEVCEPDGSRGNLRNPPRMGRTTFPAPL